MLCVFVVHSRLLLSSNSIVWTYHNVFNHSVGLLDYFQCLAKMSKASMSILVAFGAHTYFF